jgi:hypothetical protein
MGGGPIPKHPADPHGKEHIEDRKAAGNQDEAEDSPGDDQETTPPLTTGLEKHKSSSSHSGSVSATAPHQHSAHGGSSHLGNSLAGGAIDHHRPAGKPWQEYLDPWFTMPEKSPAGNTLLRPTKAVKNAPPAEPPALPPVPNRAAVQAQAMRDYYEKLKRRDTNMDWMAGLPPQVLKSNAIADKASTPQDTQTRASNMMADPLLDQIFKDLGNPDWSAIKNFEHHFLADASNGHSGR